MVAAHFILTITGIIYALSSMQHARILRYGRRGRWGGLLQVVRLGLKVIVPSSVVRERLEWPCGIACLCYARTYYDFRTNRVIVDLVSLLAVKCRCYTTTVTEPILLSATSVQGLW